MAADLNSELCACAGACEPAYNLLVTTEVPLTTILRSDW